jgi:hypothetical protein
VLAIGITACLLLVALESVLTAWICSGLEPRAWERFANANVARWTAVASLWHKVVCFFIGHWWTTEINGDTGQESQECLHCGKTRENR